MSLAEQTCPGQGTTSSDPFFGQHYSKVCCQKGAGEGEWVSICWGAVVRPGAAGKGGCGLL